jgi:hypothetical protein
MQGILINLCIFGYWELFPPKQFSNSQKMTKKGLKTMTARNAIALRKLLTSSMAAMEYSNCQKKKKSNANMNYKTP